jgi:hypothetical protein
MEGATGKTVPPGGSSGKGRTIWDFATAAAALAFLTLIVWIVLDYSGATDKAATILGIVMPVFGAVFGVSIGYWTGNQTGKAEGRDTAKRQIKDAIGPIIRALEKHFEALARPIRVEGVSPTGQDAFVLPQGYAVPTQDLEGIQDQIRDLDSYLRAL